jgi:hypothetical protein
MAPGSRLTGRHGLALVGHHDVTVTGPGEDRSTREGAMTKGWQ